MNESPAETNPETRRAPVLSPSERKGITRMYRDAAIEHGIDQGVAPEDIDDVSDLHWGEVSIADRVKIQPLEFSGIVDEGGAWIPEYWTILVTDPTAPDTIRGQFIAVTNDELPEEQCRIPTPVDQIHKEEIRSLDASERTDLIAFLRDLPHGDVLRELT